MERGYTAATYYNSTNIRKGLIYVCLYTTVNGITSRWTVEIPYDMEYVVLLVIKW
jgi:hypothetical protein